MVSGCRALVATAPLRRPSACVGDHDLRTLVRAGWPVTGVRHAWTFDDMFSAFATQGLEQKTKGQFTREELASLAKVNVESLQEYAYFTYVKVNGKRQKDALSDPVDYYLEYDPKETVLTLHFTLPFKTPVKAKALDVEVYDPDFFIDFGFAEKDQVRLVNAPAQCSVSRCKTARRLFLGGGAARQVHGVGSECRHGCKLRQPGIGDLSVTRDAKARLVLSVLLVALLAAARFARRPPRNRARSPRCGSRRQAGSSAGF